MYVVEAILGKKACFYDAILFHKDKYMDMTQYPLINVFAKGSTQHVPRFHVFTNLLLVYICTAFEISKKVRNM